MKFAFYSYEMFRRWRVCLQKIYLESTSSFWLFFRYSRWIVNILLVGHSRPIDEKDIYAVTKGFRAERNAPNLDKFWQRQLATGKPRLFDALTKLYGTQIVFWSVTIVVLEVVAV